jgi:hypothetical protein
MGNRSAQRHGSARQGKAHRHAKANGYAGHKVAHRLMAAERQSCWRGRFLRNLLDRQETDLTLIRFAAASGARGMAR